MTAPLATAEPAGPARLDAVDVLMWSVFCGLAAGFLQLAVLGVKKFVFGAMLRRSVEFLWMIPLGEVLWGLPLGATVALAVWAAPRWTARPLALAAVAFPAWLSALLVFPPLHGLAMSVLAAGLAWQTARWFCRDDARRRWLRRSAWGLACVWVCVLLAVRIAQAQRERAALAALGPAPDGAPNVLLIVLDTVRARNLSLYGYPRRTSPRLDELAADGVTFERAIATAPWTLPSHASLMTGRPPHELSADWQTPLDDRPRVLAEAFAARGYCTAGFSANVLNASASVGLARGFGHFEDYRPSVGQVLASSSLGAAVLGSAELREALDWFDIPGRRSAGDISEAFLEWLDGRSDPERPFFVFLNYFDAHHPYLPPEPFAERFGPKTLADRREIFELLQGDPDALAPERIQEAVDAYDGAIAALDDALGQLRDELRKRGLLDGTVLVVTADHGEEFDEHGVLEHGNTLYRPSLEVPLVVRFPEAAPAGVRVAGPISLVDVPATILDLAGIEDAAIGGRSLAPLWSEGGEQALRTALSELSQGVNTPPDLPVSRGDMHSLFSEEWHYIANGDERIELYDVEEDSWEQRDLAQDPNEQAALRWLRSHLTGDVGGQ